jgi:WD40 repeat protein
VDGYQKYTSEATFSPDGRYLAVGYWDGVVKVWDLADGTLVRTFYGHVDYIYALLFSLDSRILITSSYDRTIKFWDLQTGEEIYWLKLPGVANRMAFSPDGKLLAIITNDGVINIFGIPCGEVVDVKYPKIIPGALPTPTPLPISPLCSVVFQSPEDHWIKYRLTDDGFHEFVFPSGTTPNPKESILWSNMKKGTISGGVITIWIPESRAIVEYDDNTGSVSVQIPDCNPPWY